MVHQPTHGIAPTRATPIATYIRPRALPMRASMSTRRARSKGVGQSHVDLNFTPGFIGPISPLCSKWGGFLRPSLGGLGHGLARRLVSARAQQVERMRARVGDGEDPAQ